MNLTRLLILGLLAERGPGHGHQLRRDAELAEVDRWAGVGVGSLHRELRGLEAEGLIEAVRTERVGRRPERTVYCLTDEGRRELSVLRQQAASQLDPAPDPLSVLLVFAGTDDPAELAALLARRKQALHAKAGELALARAKGEEKGYLLPRSRRCRLPRSAGPRSATPPNWPGMRSARNCSAPHRGQLRSRPRRPGPG